MKSRVVASLSLVSTATTFEIPEMAPRNQPTGYQGLLGTVRYELHQTEKWQEYPTLIPGTSYTTVTVCVRQHPDGEQTPCKKIRCRKKRGS